MRELRFDGLSPDGTRLVLAGKDGQRYTVLIDERLEAAVRRDRARMSQVEIEQSGVLRPREIQARIRAGATAEDVAAASGLSLEHIRRFEGPVLTERAWVAQQAQATEVRRPGGDIELRDLVAERLAAEGVDPTAIAWDSWRRDDGVWVVIATFPVPPNTHVATWTYDSVSRTMTVADDNARSLSAITVDAPLRLSAPRPLLASVADLDEDEESDEPGIVILSPVGGRTAAASDDDDHDDAEPTDAGAADAEEDAEPDAEGDAESGDMAARSSFADVGPEDARYDDASDETRNDTASDDDAPDAGDGESDEASSSADATEEPAGAAADDATADQPDGFGDGPTADAEDVPLFDTPTPSPAPHRNPGKPAVPSFDDILFGPGPKH